MTTLKQEFEAVRNLLPPGLSEIERDRIFSGFMAGAFIALHGIHAGDEAGIVARYEEAMRFMVRATGGPIRKIRRI